MWCFLILSYTGGACASWMCPFKHLIVLYDPLLWNNSAQSTALTPQISSHQRARVTSRPSWACVLYAERCVYSMLVSVCLRSQTQCTVPACVILKVGKSRFLHPVLAVCLQAAAIVLSLAAVHTHLWAGCWAGLLLPPGSSLCQTNGKDHVFLNFLNVFWAEHSKEGLFFFLFDPPTCRL